MVEVARMVAEASAVLYLSLLLFKCVAAAAAVKSIEVARRSRPPLTRSWMTGVSVLQPILSGDPNLAKVLEDNLISLSEAEFLWLIDDDDHEAHRITSALMHAYPGHRIRTMSFAKAPEGSNPKTFKLDTGWRKAGGPYCLILDDDARLTASALKLLMGALDGGDLATALPYYVDGGTFVARLLGQFVNNNAALTYLPLLPFTPPVSINGMCYVLRKETLAIVGGFSTIMTHLADDLAMARLLQASGGRLVQSTAPVEMQTDLASWRRYSRQMHRWFLFATLLMRTQSGAMNACITVLQGLHPLLLWVMLLTAIVHPAATTWLCLGAVMIVRSLALCLVQRRLTGSVRHRPLLSLLSELLQPLHLAHAAVDRTIVWRTRVYVVRDNHDFASV